MKDVLAIIHAPGVGVNQLKMLVVKLNYYIEQYGLHKKALKINPTFPLKSSVDNQKDLSTLVIGWGLTSEPTWGKLIWGYEKAGLAKEFIALDLIERFGNDGRLLNEPKVNAGRYWSKRLQENNLKLFMDGYYIKRPTPYGMKSVLKRPQKGLHQPLRSHYILVPGDPDEMEIVRLIFDLYVNHDYTRTEICNLLIAQSIRPPGKLVKWRQRVVKAVLEDPVYIGANEYKGNIRYDVYPSLIAKSTFYEAQAKMMREQITRRDVRKMSRAFNLSSHF